MEQNEVRGVESYEEDEVILNGRVERLIRGMEGRMERLEGLWRRKENEGRMVGEFEEMEKSMKSVSALGVLLIEDLSNLC